MSLAYAARLRYERRLSMPPSRSSKSSTGTVAPIAVLIDSAERAGLAARLERAGFHVSLVSNAEEGRRAAEKGAALCDCRVLGEDLRRHSIEELIRARLTFMLERLGVEQVADLHALVIREVERGLFSLVLERCNGNKGEAARQLGLHRNTLRQKLSQLATSPGTLRQAVDDARPRPRGRARSRASRQLG